MLRIAPICSVCACLLKGEGQGRAELPRYTDAFGVHELVTGYRVTAGSNTVP